MQIWFHLYLLLDFGLSIEDFNTALKITCWITGLVSYSRNMPKVKKQSVETKKRLKKLKSMAKTEAMLVESIISVPQKSTKLLIRSRKDIRREKSKILMREKRKNVEFVANERIKRKENGIKRKENGFKTQERNREQEMKTSLKRFADRNRLRLLRENEVYRSRERARDRQRKSLMRQDHAYKSQERKRDRQRKSLLRQNGNNGAHEKLVLKVVLRKDDIEMYRKQEPNQTMPLT